MLKLKLPLTIAMLAHLLLFASLSGVLPKGAFRDFTPIEVIELAKGELIQVKAAPVQKKQEPAQTPKRIEAPVQTEPQKIVKALEETKPTPVKEPVRESKTETQKAEEQPRTMEAAREKAAEPIKKASEAVTRDKGHGEFEFRSYVRQRIEKAKFYPAWARQRGYEGTVGVKFNILPDGSVEEVKVVRPCHCVVLNRAACEAVEKAAPFNRPSGLDNKVIAMEVDLGFKLR